MPFLRCKRSKLKKPYDIVGCVGKLPSFEQTLHYRMGEFELNSLDSYLSKVKDEINKDAEQTKINSWPLNYFVSHLNDSKNIYIGVYMLHKTSDGIIHPLIIFRQLNNPVILEFPNISALLYPSFFRGANQICRQNWFGHKQQELEFSINHLRLYHHELTRDHALQMVVNRLKQYVFENYWQAVKKYFKFGVLEFWGSLLSKLNYFKTNPEKMFVLRLPLPSQGDVSIFVVFFLQLIYEVFADRFIKLQVFWHQNEDGILPMMTVCSGYLNAQQLITVTKQQTWDNLQVVDDIIVDDTEDLIKIPLLDCIQKCSHLLKYESLV